MHLVTSLLKFAVLIPRSVAWQREYLSRRYLAEMTTEDLIARTRYLVENITTLTADGQIGVLDPSEIGHQQSKIADQLWKTFTQTWLEMQIRGNVDLTNFLKNSAVPKPCYPEGSPGRRAYEQRHDRRRGQFFKFGKHEHLGQLANEGRMRLNPASTYKDSSLNMAIRDDELQIEMVAMPGSILITLPNGKVIGTKPGEVRNFTRRYRHTTNFYVWCVASFFHDRLFDDFGGNACLMIYDMDGFMAALRDALASTPLASWDLSFSEVIYLDPYNRPRELNVPTIPICKHHKYSYQHEHRIVLHPRVPVNNLDPVDLKIDLPVGCFEMISIS